MTYWREIGAAWWKRSCILMRCKFVTWIRSECYWSLRKISKWDIQNGDREIVPMKPLWFYCSREDKGFVHSTFLHICGNICVYFMKFNHLFGLHLNKKKCLFWRNMEHLNCQCMCQVSGFRDYLMLHGKNRKHLNEHLLPLVGCAAVFCLNCFNCTWDTQCLRPRKINVLFPISSPICHRVGRSATFFFLSPFFFQIKFVWRAPIA